MIDPRATKLANLLVNYSCKVKKDDNVLVEAIDIPNEFTRTLVAAVADAGARPIVWIKSSVVNRALMLCGSQDARCLPVAPTPADTTCASASR